MSLVGIVVSTRILLLLFLKDERERERDGVTKCEIKGVELERQKHDKYIRQEVRNEAGDNGHGRTKRCWLLRDIQSIIILEETVDLPTIHHDDEGQKESLEYLHEVNQTDPVEATASW